MVAELRKKRCCAAAAAVAQIVLLLKIACSWSCELNCWRQQQCSSCARTALRGDGGCYSQQKDGWKSPSGELDELGGGWVWDPQPPGLQQPAAIWELDVEKKTPTALGKVMVRRNAQTKSE